MSNATFADVFNSVVAESPKAAEPNWRTPNDFSLREAASFTDPANAQAGGLPLDPAVAVKLLKLGLNGGFGAYKDWYEGSRKLVASPEATVPGMMRAAHAINEQLNAGSLIAVYCDYDVDGTSGGEALRAGIEPYLQASKDAPRLMYGYADAQSGFGLTNQFVQDAHAAGASMIITLDCGSGQSTQVQLAQNLGMLVIVVDHHGVDPSNPADHHLNPHLSEPASSHNTGAQLAWKLAAAVQIVREGRTRSEHWERAMHSAGLGFMADMGSVALPENRAFAWAAHTHPAPGVRALANALGEDPTIPGALIRTQACMNLPKRTTKVSAADVGALFAAQTIEEAAPIVQKLLSAYEEAVPVRKEMLAEALLQTGERVKLQDGSYQLTRPDERIAFAVLDSFSDYAGYTGPVASQISSKTGKPAVICAYKGVDQHGQELYKFSSRNEAGVPSPLGELIPGVEHHTEWSLMLAKACTIKKLNESDEIVEAPVVGGHLQVVSGTCTRENLPLVKAAYEQWAQSKTDDEWIKKPWDGPDATLMARKVAASRLAAIEQQATRLGPYGRGKQLLIAGNERTGDKEATISELMISVMGVLTLTGDADENNPNWLVGAITLDNGDTRDVRYPADAEERPVGISCEWILRVGKPGAYWLRKFHNPSPAA